MNILNLFVMDVFIIIKEIAVFQKKGGKKKRWGAGKSNLRHSPYFLKDGDTIGVKVRISK